MYSVYRIHQMKAEKQNNNLFIHISFLKKNNTSRIWMKFSPQSLHWRLWGDSLWYVSVCCKHMLHELPNFSKVVNCTKSKYLTKYMGRLFGSLYEFFQPVLLERHLLLVSVLSTCVQVLSIVDKPISEQITNKTIKITADTGNGPCCYICSFNLLMMFTFTRWSSFSEAEPI
jgi:hypothetical protein